jgi:uncharacterized protein YqjF (DUF2071 family)
MHQNWGKLLFMHWPIEAEALRPLVPSAMEIDTFAGSAWIAIAPFTMWDIRALPPYLPAIPGLSRMHELNVRTYVYFNGAPGVWFFSLDCNSKSAVFAARRFYFLPYHNAEIDLRQEDETIHYNLTRTEDPPARFAASWRIGEALSRSQPGSLEFFLTERYCLYSEYEGEIHRAQIHHQQWPLQKAVIASLDSNMVECNGLPHLNREPLVHYAEEVNVDIWPLEKLVSDL